MRSRLAQRDRNGCGFQKCLLELDCGGDSCKKVAKIGAPRRGVASLWKLRTEMGARRFVDDRFVARAHRRHQFVATAGKGREPFFALTYCQSGFAPICKKWRALEAGPVLSVQLHEPGGDLNRFSPRVRLQDCPAADDLLGLRERAVGHGDLALARGASPRSCGDLS